LTIIHEDEVTHVAIGHKYLAHLCTNNKPPLDPISTFREEVKTHFFGRLRGPFNEADRMKAGMSREYYEELEGKGFSGKRDEQLVFES
jgi:uncharacterized ferritin-like protein (DUF455 family)